MNRGKKINLAAFNADAAKGLSTAVLAKAYGISWTRARQMRAAALPESPVVSGEPEVWDIVLEVPEGRLDELVRHFTHEEAIHALFSFDEGSRALALQAVLQYRMFGLEPASKDAEPALEVPVAEPEA